MPTAVELAMITGGQLRAAAMRQPLAALNAEPVPDDMRKAPSNDIGAYYRAAYWLATASRLSLGKGGSSLSLTANAAWYATRAGLDLGPIATFVGTGRGVTGAIPAMLDAAQTAEAAGVPEVGRELRALATPTAIQRSVERQADAGVLGRWFGTDSLPSMGTVFGGVALVALAIVAVVKRNAWWPWVKRTLGFGGGKTKTRKTRKAQKAAA